MQAQLQRRVQRYGWDRAAACYEALWHRPLAPARAALLRAAAPAAGERLLDVACGTGLLAFEAAPALGAAGQALGVDLSGAMVAAAAERARDVGLANFAFRRMDAEDLALPDNSFDLATCALGLMYLPSPEQALAELRRVLRPGGRLAVAVWGCRERCGWAPVFPLVEAEVASEICPLFFRLGEGEVLAQACRDAGFVAVESRRLAVTLAFDSAAAASDAALVGGPTALAWSRFPAGTRERVRADYLAAIAPFRQGTGYALPAEFVIASGVVTAA